MLLDMKPYPPLLAMFGETETGSAGEQPVRDNRIQNEEKPLAQSYLAVSRFLILVMPNKTQHHTVIQTTKNTKNESTYVRT